MNRGGIQREQLIGIVPLATVAEVMVHFNEPAFLQLLDGAPHGAVGDSADSGDGLPAGIASVCFVVAAQQVTVDGERYRRQPVRKYFSWEHDEGFSLHFLVLHFVVKKSRYYISDSGEGLIHKMLKCFYPPYY